MNGPAPPDINDETVVDCPTPIDVFVSVGAPADGAVSTAIDVLVELKVIGPLIIVVVEEEVVEEEVWPWGGGMVVVEVEVTTWVEVVAITLNAYVPADDGLNVYFAVPPDGMPVTVFATIPLGYTDTTVPFGYLYARAGPV